MELLLTLAGRAPRVSCSWPALAFVVLMAPMLLLLLLVGRNEEHGVVVGRSKGRHQRATSAAARSSKGRRQRAARAAASSKETSQNHLNLVQNHHGGELIRFWRV